MCAGWQMRPARYSAIRARRLAFGHTARIQAERRFRLNAVVEQTVTLYRDLVGMR